jgi:hypothetical protein
VVLLALPPHPSEGSKKVARAGSSKVWAVVMAAMVGATVLALMWFGGRASSKRHDAFARTGLDRLTDRPGEQAYVYGRSPRRKAVRNPEGQQKRRQAAGDQERSVAEQAFPQAHTDTSYSRGLLGVTLHPNFSSNHYVYIFYTATRPTVHNRVSRFTARGDVVAAGSEKVIIELPTLGTSGGYYGGSLRFGSDGKLYVGVGDDTQPDAASRSVA